MKCAAASTGSVEVTEICAREREEYKIRGEKWNSTLHSHTADARKTHAHTNYDDLMQTTIFHKVFLIMYSDLRRV